MDPSDWAARLAAAVALRVAEINKEAEDQPVAPPARPYPYVRRLRVGRSRYLVAGPPGKRPSIPVHSVRATSPEVVEVIYSSRLVGPDGVTHYTDPDLKGIRIDFASVQAASQPIRESSIDELASHLILLGIEEPRPLEEFLPPDSNGVRWLPLDRWLDYFQEPEQHEGVVRRLWRRMLHRK